MRKRMMLARIIVWLIIISLIAAIAIEMVFADQAIPSTPPRNINVSDIGYEDHGGQNWFVDFSWEAPNYPDDVVETMGEKSQHFYFNKVERGTGRLVEDVLEFTLNYNSTEFNPTQYGIELEHGSIYEFYGRSRYTYGELGEYSFTSGKSNRVKFLTDLEFSAELISGTNDIKIVWDDVWDTDGRIDYRILISDTSGFTQPPSVPDIIGSNIGTENSRVTVSGGHLEYIYTNALPGREYSIKIIPLVNSDVAVTPDEELPVVRIKTEILLRAKYMGESVDGDGAKWLRWMLFWDPIIKGSIGNTTFTRVEYKLYRYDEAGNETLFAVIEDGDRFEVKLKPEDIEKYKYKVEADAYRPDGSTVPFYSTTQISLEEQIPEYPASPEFIDSFPTADPEPIEYEKLLTNNSVTLLWTAPVTGDGDIDTEIYYDLYLCDNLDDLDLNLEKLPPLTKKIGSNMKMGAGNEVHEVDTGKLLGYKYTINQLNPNTVYYAVMVAKKNYLTESEDGEFMISKPYLSKQSIKVIITKPSKEADEPWAPPSPPFRLKREDAIGKTSISFQMEKSWTEMYNDELKKWLYVIREDDPEGDLTDGYYNSGNSYTYDEYMENRELSDEDPEKKIERDVSYNAGWEVMIHCVEYEKALNNVENLTGRDYISYSDLSENHILLLQEPINPVPIPDIEHSDSQIFYLDADGLDPNTTYLVWITIYNTDGDTESEPSDPIMVTTLPDYPPIVEHPTVPTDLKGIAADTYVDLFWSFRDGYSYNIRYGTEDDVENANNTVSVSYEQLQSQPYIRIEQLEADTVYYFWIQAISPPEAGSVLSEWSNSLLVKTEAYNPPPRPRGFGIKDTADAITENSIFYEWMADESVTYILEISENADFSDSWEYNVDDSEYRVTGLRSNVRYFARLYSYSTETSLRSEPAPVIMIVTRKGRGEYDSDVPIDDIPVGDMVEIDGVSIDGIWNSRVTGINAHRLSEKIRLPGNGTFSIDLTNPPPNTEIIRVELDDEVIETLSGVMESLIIIAPDLELTITPGSFLQDNYFKLKQSIKNITVRIDIRTPVYELNPEKNRQFIRPVSEINVTAGVNESFLPLGRFIRPVKVAISVEPSEIEKINMRYYDFETGNWSGIASTWLPDDEIVAAYLQKSGAVAATEIRAANIGDISGNKIQPIVQNILTKYEMPSLSGKNLNPLAELTVNEAMKHLFDIIPYEYGNENATEKAIRAGFLLRQYAKSGNWPLRRDQAIYSAVMILDKKIKIDLESDVFTDNFQDFDTIPEPFRDALAFSIANGIVNGDGNRIYPERTITLYELLTIIERVLMYAGEI